MIVPGSENAASRDAAWLQSRNCPICGGNGLVTVFHPAHQGHPVATIEDEERGQRAVPRQVAAHCVCELGRWMRVRLPAEVMIRIPDVQAILDDRSAWLLDDPGMAEFAPGLRPKRWREMLRDIGQNVAERNTC